MYKWKRYFGTQIKRTIKTFPQILIFTMVLTIGLCLILQIVLTINASKENNQVVQIGIVGDMSESYLGIGISVIKNLDSVKSMANIQSMSEEEAKNLLLEGAISAYVVIPDGFISSLMTGENKPIKYVTTSEAQGLGGILINELVAAISDMVTLSQNAVYSMQVYLIENAMQEQLWDATDAINIEILEAFLNRTDIYEMQLVGIENNLSMKGYFFCSILLLFMLLWGIASVALLAREDVSLFRVLYRKGFSAALQVVSEWLAYCVLLFWSICCVMAGAFLLLHFADIRIQEWDALGAIGQLLFCVKLLPVVIMLAAFQMLLYEIASGVVNGILAQFVSAISLAYISGCLYPISFFPEVIQRLAYVLPTGVGLRYLRKNLSVQNVWGECIFLLLYTILFLTFLICVRKRRIVGK